MAVLRTPGGSVQPEAAIGPDGVIHLVSLKGDPAAADVLYTRLDPERSSFAESVRVNSQPGSAVALGTVRGAQIALGREGRIHVAWNGSGGARPANPDQGSPLLYARSGPGARGFEPQRNLMRITSGLDGGGSLAADREGNVLVGWHGRPEGAPEAEARRRFVVARSRDDGATFGLESPSLSREAGACGCCGSMGFADARGAVSFLFRAATENTGRDMLLLTTRDGGVTFRETVLARWRLFACPMSTASLAEGGSGITAAWEGDGQVFFCKIDPDGTTSRPVSPPGTGGRKHPAVAVNGSGETLLAWAEGTGWQRGGALAWRLFDPAGRPTRESGRIADGVPAWSLPAVMARRDGGFVILH